MPRATKKDPFFIYAPKSSGYWKGKRLMGVNHSFEGDRDELSLEDLLKFLKKHNIEPADVKINAGFTTYAKV